MATGCTNYVIIIMSCFSSHISLLVFTPNASWEWGYVAQMWHCITPEECRMGNYGDRASLEGYSQHRGMHYNLRNPKDLTITQLPKKPIGVHSRKA